MDTPAPIIALCFLGVFSSAETPQSYCPSPLIQAEEGRNVSLPCYVDPSVDLSAYTVDWKHTDLNDVVFSWRHGQENHGAQAASYRSRASIDSGDLSRGNLTLQIFSARLSDSGRYRCFVPKLKAFCIVHLNVTKEINVRSSTTTSPNLHSTTTTLKPNDPDKRLAVLLPVGIFLLAVVGFCLKKRVKIRQCVGKLKGQKRGVDRSSHVELQSLENSTMKYDTNKAS
ncbi:butyrophilin subfamily 2 member A2-like isoform X2 [Astatotilapia calliptera]|uniref:butyrophilin subfamily 2 member A2-like isoform X2 n=1 Tax=Astatotilapia calliptera TaxID=8154 RepID=UPI000E3F9E08|nr:butyrophilin subfamily 2 member A2-like isoform X2 [Astatotilapia calliptera]